MHTCALTLVISTMIRLLKGVRPIGENQHRSGWPYVKQGLRQLESENGILVDDFVERSFSYDTLKKPHLENWVGFFHNPIHVPTWFDSEQNLQCVIASELFRDSLPQLKLCVSFSQCLGDWLEINLGIPCVCLKHPTEFVPDVWTPEKYQKNEKPLLVQIGWWLRNLKAPEQIPPIRGITRAHLRMGFDWVKKAEKAIARYWKRKGTRPEYPGVVKLGMLSNSDYDKLLDRNIVLLELFDTSANNVIVEALVRNTPVVVNRLPALEEYLGMDYPLFYESLAEVPNLCAFEKIIEGHEYIKALDKTPLTLEAFLKGFSNAIRTLQDNRKRDTLQAQ